MKYIEKNSCDYNFAFSFAGEDRHIVEEIKIYLKNKGYSVFYDNDYQYELVGKDLYSFLREIYKDKGKFIVCFISEYYTKKVWTNLEFSAIKERLMATFFAGDFLIPIILDGTILKDIPTFIGFYEHKSIEETAKLLMNKFNTHIVEDNYLYNVSNCIQFICQELCDLLNNHGFFAKRNSNRIIVSDHEFLFSPDNTLNIPCILVYSNNLTTPDLFISWDNCNKINFNIHSFCEMKPILQNQSIKDLIYHLEQYVKEYI